LSAPGPSPETGGESDAHPPQQATASPDEPAESCDRRAASPTSASKAGIAFGERVRLAGEGTQPIAQRPVESFDMHGASWPYTRPQCGADLHGQQSSMRIAMFDRLRQRHRRGNHPRRTPPFACQPALAIRPHQDAPIAVPARTPPAQLALLSPLNRDGHRLLDQVFTRADRWRRRPQTDCPDPGPGIPSVLLRQTGKLCRFFCTNDQNSSIST